MLYPSGIATQKVKKLGIYFESDDALRVKKVAENSVAQTAKIEEGDKVLAFNQIEVNNLFDLKTELAFAKKSSTLTLERDSKKIDIDIEFSE
jgi:S1-C subfamily serine protease